MIRVQIPRYDVEIKNKTMFSPTHVHLPFVFYFWHVHFGHGVFYLCPTVGACNIKWDKPRLYTCEPKSIPRKTPHQLGKTWRFHSASIWAIDDLPLPLWVPAAHRSRFKPFQTHNLATTKQTNLDMSRLARQPPMTLGVRRQTTWMSPRPFSGRSAMQTKRACPLWRVFFATWSCMS